MALRVAINGFGRVGRSVLRTALQRNVDLEFVGINDLTNPEKLRLSFKYDSIHGVFHENIALDGKYLVVGGNRIRLTAVKNPARLPWKELGVDVVIDSTGVFRTRDQLEGHLRAGAKKVVLAVPPKDALDATIVMGVNSDMLHSGMKLVSNASCTTNCAAPVVKVLNDNWGIMRGYMVTVHAYTNDQRLLDFPHKDPRRARAAVQSIIPTTTGAAKAIGQVIPELEGKLQGMAYRVPVADGSVVDLVVELRKKASVRSINNAMKQASMTDLRGILQYTTDPIVSVDIIDNPHSSVFDSLLTQTLNGNWVKVSSWYDNEWGYSNRIIDLLERLFYV
ncbi:MAG: type I glyceraldehyde-3-phosphate dehydrogenase [Candidatus Lernaella stagnicola]|nr:type I glyceraldehyde-3-phosphate dehydrogenase [Candidatus Lernaella stagnicola]